MNQLTEKEISANGGQFVPAPLGIAWRLCRRELRVGYNGFRIFILCIALGVAAIASVGSISQTIVSGLRSEARALLGGEIDLRLAHQEASKEQLTWLRKSGRLSIVAEMRTMARGKDHKPRALTELKAVDQNYPLFGEMKLSNSGSLRDALMDREGIWPAVADYNLAERLELEIGDDVHIGNTKFRLVAFIKSEPDRSSQVIALGPRLMIPLAAMPETGLMEPGSLFHYHYRIDIEGSVEDWIKRVNIRFKNAGWQIRDYKNSTPGIQRFVERVTLFLTLVGLSALLVGGVGVSSAVRAYLLSKTKTIATLKCLGSSCHLIFLTYMLQILILSMIGITLGLVVGTLAPVFALPPLAHYLPVTTKIQIYPLTLILALTFGILVTLLFTLWPLARAQAIPAASLFRDLVSPVASWPKRKLLLCICLIASALSVLVIASAENKIIALYFVAGAAVTFLVFHCVSILVIRVSRSIPRPFNTGLRIAIGNLQRPGGPTSSVIPSLGLSLTVLVAVVLIEGNINNQLDQALSEEAPGFYFIDLQTNQLERFESLVTQFPGVHKVSRVPMLRGRITHIAGTEVEKISPPPDYAWIVKGDRGLTWMREPPTSGSKIVEGNWWTADYSGPPLISFDAKAAEAFGIGVGDTLTLNVLGREIKAEIVNLRLIDWNTFGINFVIIFSPGWLEKAPQTHIATAHLEASAESELESIITDSFPNLSVIRVREVLSNINTLLAKVGTAVKGIAAIAILVGALVLAGTIAANHKRRVYEAVVLKVLGATRRNILVIFVIEFTLLGLITAMISTIIGSIVAWSVVSFLMEASWTFIPSAVVTTSVLCIIITVALGLVGTWRALGQNSAPYLRNE